MKRKVYNCPACHSKVSPSSRMQIAGINCCRTCFGFLKAARLPFPLQVFLNPYDITSRKKVNSRFPGTIPHLMERIIVQSQAEGEHSDENIPSICERVRNVMDTHFLQNLKRNNSYSLIFSFLRTLDWFYETSEYAHSRVIGRHTLAADKTMGSEIWSTLQNIGVVGQSLETTIESSLASGFNKSSTQCQKQDLFALFELACDRALVNYFVDTFLGVWKRGKLIVGKGGLQFLGEPEDQSRFQKMKDNMAIDHGINVKSALGDDYQDVRETDSLQAGIDALENLREGKTVGGQVSILGEDEDEFILAIDDTHKGQFGHSFSEKLLALIHLGLPSQQLPDDWAFEDKVVSFLSEKLRVKGDIAVSILHSLELTGPGIRNDGAFPFAPRRSFRLLRRPLPKFAVGARSIYYLSGIFISRAARHIRAEYQNGSHPELQGTPIQTMVQDLNKRNAHYFVKERIGRKLENLGFLAKCAVKKIGDHDISALKGIGEIDIVAVNPKGTKLIVGEGKFTALPNVHVRQIRSELSDYLKPEDGYADKLRRKVRWVKDHKQDVSDFMGIKEVSSVGECIPVFFTNMYCPASEFINDIEFVKEVDLQRWCSAI